MSFEKLGTTFTKPDALLGGRKGKNYKLNQGETLLSNGSRSNRGREKPKIKNGKR